MKKIMFGNFIAYDFSRPFHVPDAKEVDSFIVDNPLQGNLEYWLKQFEFTPCKAQDTVKYGWAAPLGVDSEMLTHFCGDHILLICKEEVREIPPAELARQLGEKLKKFEIEEGRPAKKKEREGMKEDLVSALLPHTFPKFSRIPLWIDLVNQRVCVEATSPSKAEKALSLLRKTLGSLPAIPFGNDFVSADTAMTQWVLGEPPLPAHYQLGYAAKLASAKAGDGSITIKDRDLKSEEVQAHLITNMFVTSLALDYGVANPLPEINEIESNKEKESEPEAEFSRVLSFTLTENLYFKSIKLADTVQEQNENIGIDDFAARFDADFALISGELAALLNQISIDLTEHEI